MNYTASLAVLLSRFRFELPPELAGPGALWELQANRMVRERRVLSVLCQKEQPMWTRCPTAGCGARVPCLPQTNQPKNGLPMRCIPHVAN